MHTEIVWEPMHLLQFPNTHPIHLVNIGVVQVLRHSEPIRVRCTTDHHMHWLLVDVIPDLAHTLVVEIPSNMRPCDFHAVRVKPIGEVTFSIITNSLSRSRFLVTHCTTELLHMMVHAHSFRHVPSMYCRRVSIFEHIDLGFPVLIDLPQPEGRWYPALGHLAIDLEISEALCFCGTNIRCREVFVDFVPLFFAAGFRIVVLQLLSERLCNLRRLLLPSVQCQVFAVDSDVCWIEEPWLASEPSCLARRKSSRDPLFLEDVDFAVKFVTHFSVLYPSLSLGRSRWDGLYS